MSEQVKYCSKVVEFLHFEQIEVPFSRIYCSQLGFKNTDNIASNRWNSHKTQ